MELISLQFIIFLAALVALYYLTGKHYPQAQWRVLLVGSIAFIYMAGGLVTLGCLMLTSLTCWGAAIMLDKLEQACRQKRKQAKGRDAKRAVRATYVKRKRRVLLVSLGGCLALLFYFKYWNVVLYYLNRAESFTSLNIMLPLGLSFYLFQSLGYLIDSYNAKYPPQRNFLRFLLFTSYFPQIIEGPINRYDTLGETLYAPHAPDSTLMARGALRFGLGILKKVAIANVLANAVNVVFERAAGPHMPGILAIYGVFAYSIQMYADFSGGIDLVEGASELFGIPMAQNFRQPYFSISLADFWRRWHMSLGAWMRDYVFYPLAVTPQSKKLGKWAAKHCGRHIGRTLPACVANILVFLLVGLWHGAQAHYLLWGLYNGVIVALSDLATPLFARLKAITHVRDESIGFRAFSILRTFCIVCIGRIFDCFVHVSDAFSAIGNIITGQCAMPLGDALVIYGATYATVYGFPLPTIMACLIVLVIDIRYECNHDVREDILNMNPLARAAVIGALAMLCACAAAFDTTGGGGGFLYANF